MGLYEVIFYKKIQMKKITQPTSLVVIDIAFPTFDVLVST
jgi:hypothetical protein